VYISRFDAGAGVILSGTNSLNDSISKSFAPPECNELLRDECPVSLSLQRTSSWQLNALAASHAPKNGQIT